MTGREYDSFVSEAQNELFELLNQCQAELIKEFNLTDNDYIYTLTVERNAALFKMALDDIEMADKVRQAEIMNYLVDWNADIDYKAPIAHIVLSPSKTKKHPLHLNVYLKPKVAEECGLRLLECEFITTIGNRTTKLEN